MSARTAQPVAALLAAALAAIAMACSPQAPPAPEGVGPASSPRTAAAERSALELARPEPPASAAPVPVAEPAPVAAAPAIGPDIADLGPFDVISWDEARARAEKQIGAGNAEAELEKIRLELENKP